MKKREMTALLTGVFMVLACVSGWAQGYYHCQNRSILAPDGSTFLIRGVAASFWLNPESYALHLGDVHNRHLNNPSSIRSRIRDILGSDADAEAFWAAYEANLFTQTDLADLAAEGFNTLRLPFNYRLISPENQPGVIDQAGLEKLGTIVQWCANAGLAVILDMHSCPGGQSHDGPADPERTFWYWSDSQQNWFEAGVACLWAFDQGYYNDTGHTPAFNKQRTIDIWTAIAAYFANEPAVLGYELINEPYLPSGIPESDLRDLQVQITAAIRTVDTNHIIFASGNEYSGSVTELVPPWDANMALAFHRYWCAVDAAVLAEFVNVSTQYNVPLCMTESGENSSDWFYGMKELLEANQIGWCWWGVKKVDSTSAAFSAAITEDYQYVIDNFRDSPIDAVRAKAGLMQMAANLASDSCDFDPGCLDALLSSGFGSGDGLAFAALTVPGTINAVDYNIGADGTAYADAESRNESGAPGGATWNLGYLYRNDGVDITTTSEGCGYKVGWISTGEWLKFTAQVATTKKYTLMLRTAAPANGGKLRIYCDGSPVTSDISIPSSGSYDIWKTVKVRNVTLPAGTHTLEIRMVTGGFDLASMKWQ